MMRRCTALLPPLLILVGLLALPWVAPRSSAMGLVAEDATPKDPAVGSGGGSDPVAKPPPKDAPLANTTLAYVNDRALALIKDWATKRNLASAVVGTDRVRFLTIGSVHDDLAKALDKGVLTLNGLEFITGDQETFIAKKPPDGQRIMLVLFASKNDILGFIDDMRAAKIMPQPDGEDLIKKHPAFAWPRMILASADDVRNLLPEWAVYGVAVSCIDAFYNSRNPRQTAPTWLREGLACDMQQLLCKDIRDVTIAYEDKEFPMSQNWASDIRKLLDSGSPSNKDAAELMRIPLDACPNVFYQQFWSLESYIRMHTPTTKGPKNKLRRLLDDMAAGDTGMAAYTKVFGVNDKALTRDWRIWADAEH